MDMKSRAVFCFVKTHFLMLNLKIEYVLLLMLMLVRTGAAVFGLQLGKGMMVEVDIAAMLLTRHAC